MSIFSRGKDERQARQGDELDWRTDPRLAEFDQRVASLDGQLEAVRAQLREREATLASYADAMASAILRAEDLHSIREQHQAVKAVIEGLRVEASVIAKARDAAAGERARLQNELSREYYPRVRAEYVAAVQEAAALVAPLIRANERVHRAFWLLGGPGDGVGPLSGLDVNGDTALRRWFKGAEALGCKVAGLLPSFGLDRVLAKAEAAAAARQAARDEFESEHERVREAEGPRAARRHLLRHLAAEGGPEVQEELAAMRRRGESGF